MAGRNEPKREPRWCKWCHNRYTVEVKRAASDEGVCPECAGVAEWASETVFPQWDEQD